MAWKCVLCAFMAITLRLLLRHIHTEHSRNPNFSIKCDLDGCPRTYDKYNSFYRHVMREHNHLLESRGDDRRDIDRDPRGNYEILEQNQLMEIDQGECDQDTFGQNEDEDLDTLKHSNKRNAVEYVMHLKEFHKLRETVTSDIVHGTNSLVQKYLDTLKKRIYKTLRKNDIDPVDVIGLEEDFDVDLPFDDITTAHARQKFIKENYVYVEPEAVQIGQRLQTVGRKRHKHLEIVAENFMYISLVRSIEQFLQNEDIYSMIREFSPETPDGFYADLASGSSFQNHELFSRNNKALQIILYFDDLDICNPMSKRAGKHKIGVFYYTLANLKSCYRSRLPAIRVVAVIKRKLMNKYSISPVLRRIQADLQLLSVGVSMTINGRQEIIHGACSCFVGDTLASNEFGGFKLGVGFSFQKCRSCECTFNDMQRNFRENDFLHRSQQRYDEQCYELSNAETQAMRDTLSTAYGITHCSVARHFPYFDITKFLPQDIMHILFEGLAIYEIKAALKHLIGCKLLTLADLNNVIEHFHYGYHDKHSQPVSIPKKLFDSEETNSLGQTASSMMVFMRLLPFFLIEKLNCDAENDYFRFLVELCELSLILLSPTIACESVEMLKVIIADHLFKFKQLFPEKNIIPKQHYLLHIPSMIEQFGAPTNFWSMRFEGKHHFVKEHMSRNYNFTNIEKSLIQRCAMYECTLNVCKKHPLFSGDSIFGAVNGRIDQIRCRQTISAFFGTDPDTIISVSEVSWVTHMGQKFVPEECVVAFGELNDLPEFGKLVSIWVATEEPGEDASITNIYLNLNMFETVNLNENNLSYEVKESDHAQGLELVHIESLFVYSPLHIYTGKNKKMYVPVPYDLSDIVRLKKTSTM